MLQAFFLLPDPFTLLVQKGLRWQYGPITPTAPLKMPIAALAIMRRRRINFWKGAVLVCFFSFSFAPSLLCAAHMIEVHAQGKPQRSQGRPEEQNVLTLRNTVVQTFW